MKGWKNKLGIEPSGGVDYSRVAIGILKAERKRQKVSQEKMGGAIGIGKSGYHMIEKKGGLSVDQLHKLCDLLGLKVLIVNGENLLK